MFNSSVHLRLRRALGSVVVATTIIATPAVRAQTNQQKLPLFAKLEVKRTTLYVNEVADLTLSVYRGKRTSTGPNLDLNGMPTELLNMAEFKELKERTETVNGQPFVVRRFITTIRPTKAGRIDIRPTIRGVLHLPSGNVFGRVARRVNIPISPLTLTVLELPTAQRPEGFSGAIGRFQLWATMTTSNAAAGDLVILRTKIRGDGYLEAIRAPALTPGAGYKLYDPVIVATDLAAGSRTFEQTIIPEKEGVLNLPTLSFAYFDPARSQYMTLVDGPFRLEVDKASYVATNAAPEVFESPETRRRHISLKAAAATGRGEPIYRHRLFLPLQCVPLLMLLAAAGFGRDRRKAPKNGRATAHAEVQARLRDLAAGGGDIRQGLWEAMTRYFGASLGLAAGEITAAIVLPRLRAAGLDAAAAGELERFFAVVEAWRYAGGAADDSLDAETARESREQLDRARTAVAACSRLKALR